MFVDSTISRNATFLGVWIFRVKLFQRLTDKKESLVVAAECKPMTVDGLQFYNSSKFEHLILIVLLINDSVSKKKN